MSGSMGGVCVRPTPWRRMVAVFFGILVGGSVARAANPTPVQLFYIPFPEDQLLQGLQAIQATGSGLVPANPVTTLVSIAAVADGTIVYYDQWENGYDADIANPANLYSGGNPGGTQIWGDGNAANGAPPGVPSDLINAGTVIVLSNPVTTTDLSAIDFDGRDKIAAGNGVLGFDKFGLCRCQPPALCGRAGDVAFPAPAGGQVPKVFGVPLRAGL